MESKFFSKKGIRLTMNDGKFHLVSDFQPQGDQPAAIASLVEGAQKGLKHQTLLGVTGSGKTFTMANIVAKLNRPTLVIAHNKTLAAQLAAEFREFFPHNAVEYFVSYYDYYQPEAYIPSTDTYIEKDAKINDEIDKLRHSATASLLERNDVLVVASVSAIYGLGSPEEYRGHVLSLRAGTVKSRDEILRRLVDMQYERNDVNFTRGTFRVRGDVIEIFPASRGEQAIRVELFGDEIDRMTEIDVLTGEVLGTREHVGIFPASHFVTSRPRLEKAIERIRQELAERLAELRAQGKLLEAQRLEQRTNYDIEMMLEIGFCSGIENYSRHLEGRAAGEPPNTLLDYFPDDFLTLIDESHVTIPQIRGMYGGDRTRKLTLIEHGFRLPSAADNRPLTFEEFEQKIGQVIYVSATPGPYEQEHQQQPRGADHSSDRPTRSGDLRSPHQGPDRRSGRRDPTAHSPRRTCAGDHADQEDGRGSDRLPEGTGHQGALPALRHQDHRTHGHSARPAAWACSTCSLGSTYCGKDWTCLRCRWSPYSTQTRKASCAHSVP